MGGDSQYGDLDIFLPTWYGGRCHACFRRNHGSHGDWLCCEGCTESVPQQAPLNSFVVRSNGITFSRQHNAAVGRQPQHSARRLS
jgi:hypothetical protein